MSAPLLTKTLTASVNSLLSLTAFINNLEIIFGVQCCSVLVDDKLNSLDGLRGRSLDGVHEGGVVPAVLGTTISSFSYQFFHTFEICIFIESQCQQICIGIPIQDTCCYCSSCPWCSNSASDHSRGNKIKATLFIFI